MMMMMMVAAAMMMMMLMVIIITIKIIMKHFIELISTTRDNILNI